MSVIDRAMQGLQGPNPIPSKLSPPDALAAILVASVTVDGSIGTEESSRLQNIMATSRLLRPAVAGGSDLALEQAINLLNDHGVGEVLKACTEAIPPELRATAFALATDLVLADGRVESREKFYIDALQTALGLDDATAIKIVEVMLIKNRA